MSESMIRISACRVCKARLLIPVIKLGTTPLANKFLTKAQLDCEEAYYPLEVWRCQRCNFLELGHVVSRQILFDDYLYVSSTSHVFVRHFEVFADTVIKKLQLPIQSLVVDIGSNDGILLKPFQARGMDVLGIEPAMKIAQVAQQQGVETIVDYFSTSLAKNILKEKGPARIITATNVFAHIDDLDEVVKGVKMLLDKDGVFIIEVPYVLDLFQKCYFDLIYHEHLSYWAITSLARLLERFQMEVIFVEKVNVHGGSIRVYIQLKHGKDRVKDNNVMKFIRREKAFAFDNMKIYDDYVKKIQKKRVELLTMLTALACNKKKIIGYGAPAKGNTLLNYFNIGTDLLSYIIDDSPWKQGLYTPGKRIPVVSPTDVASDNADYMLIIAWNFAESIIKNNAEFRRRGGRFIIPFPKIVVI